MVRKLGFQKGDVVLFEGFIGSSKEEMDWKRAKVIGEIHDWAWYRVLWTCDESAWTLGGTYGHVDCWKKRTLLSEIEAKKWKLMGAL